MVDSWPAVGALARGHVGEYLSAKAMMGPFSTLLQAPFAAVGGGSGLHAYRWAAFPCVFATGLVGLYLGRFAGRRGAPVATRWLLATLFLVNPLTFEALQAGHPEELLAAALAVAAVASAAEGAGWRAAILLGLALASKQWAVIAILPTLMALPERRIRGAAVAIGVAALLVLPGIIASPGAFADVHDSAAHTGRIVTPWSLWYPLGSETTRVLHVGTTHLLATIHEAPPLVGSYSHPLIVLLALAVPLALAYRRRGFGLSGSDAMALLALLALLRSALDPVDNVYYHVPLLLALVGWDAAAGEKLPLRALAGTAIAFGMREWSLHLTDVAAYSRTYVAFALAALLAIAISLFRPTLHLDESRRNEKPDFLRDETQISGIEELSSRSM
jgi:Glycosyltransferase family 87